MSRGFIYVVASAVLALTLLACQVGGWTIDVPATTTAVQGSGGVAEEERDVSGFTGLTLAGIGDVIVELGDEEALTVEAEENLLQYLETEVHGDTLEIGIQDQINLRPSEPVHFYVTVIELDEIALSGSGNIQLPDLETDHFRLTIHGSGDVSMGELTAEDFNISIMGSGDIDVAALYADTLDINITGSGDLNIHDGQVDYQEDDIPGSGYYSARDLESERADVNIFGSGDVTLRVNEHLVVRIPGSGDVAYAGDATVDSRVNGSGHVRHIGD